MKAVLLTGYGGNEVLQVAEVPEPEPGPDDVLVDVHAASVNPIDWKTRAGQVKLLLPYRLPQILGSDCSGVVSAVGANVSRFEVGDAVFSRPDKWRIGTYAERIVVRQDEVALKPPNLSHEEAASLPLVALTAWQALFDCCGLQQGQRVFIHAGSGGVGTVAIQLARAQGAFVATTAGARNLALVKDLGADLAIDYQEQRFENEIRDYDVVFDMFGGESVTRSFPVLKRGGHLVTILGMPDAATFREYGHPFLAIIGYFANRKFQRQAKRLGVHFHYLLMRSSGAQLEQIGSLANAGKLRAVVDQVFSLDEVAAAFTYSEAGHATGKVVIKVQ